MASSRTHDLKNRSTKKKATPKPRGMNAAQFMKLLESLSACSEAKEWAKGKTMAKAWNECDNPSWMCWLLGRPQVHKKVIATIAVDFAESCTHHAEEYPAVAKCIEVVKLFIAGKATQEELSAAARSVESAASAARSAARSAASAASAARSAESAASAAWSAARSVESAAWSAWSAANKANCNIVRKHVPVSELAKLFLNKGV